MVNWFKGFFDAHLLVARSKNCTRSILSGLIASAGALQRNPWHVGTSYVHYLAAARPRQRPPCAKLDDTGRKIGILEPLLWMVVAFRLMP